MIGFHANATVHFGNVTSTGTPVDRLMQGINQIFTGQSGTFFFMMLSAFLLYRDITPKNAFSKVNRRLRTLLIPWVLWNMIGLAANHPFDQEPGQIARDFVMSRFCEQLWFVEALLLFLVLIPVYMRILRNRAAGGILVAALFILRYAAFPMMESLQVFVSQRFVNEVLRMLVHLPVYTLGAYLGLNYAEAVMGEIYQEKHRKITVLAALAVLVISYLPMEYWLQDTCFMLRSAALWVICSKQLFVFTPRWWMQVSFYIYAIHNFILYFVGKLIRLSGVFAEYYASQTVTIAFALLWRLAMTAAAFLLALISAAILMKYTPRLYEMLSGGRVPDKRNDA